MEYLVDMKMIHIADIVDFIKVLELTLHVSNDVILFHVFVIDNVSEIWTTVSMYSNFKLM